MENSASDYYIHHLAGTSSTNDYAREQAAALWAAAGACGIVAVQADAQTAGRGQRGNVWQSAAGENLLVSLMVRPTFLPVTSHFALSQAIALAVRSAMSYIGVQVELKWPNDIYVDGKKLAGILVELFYSGPGIESAIIGVGLNVNQTAFEPMDKVPVSLKMLQGTTFSVNEVLGALLDAFSYYYSALQRGEYSLLACDYKRCLMGHGKVMRYRCGETFFDARLVDVLGTGHIVLERADGTTAQYAFKEVELVM